MKTLILTLTLVAALSANNFTDKKKVDNCPICKVYKQKADKYEKQHRDSINSGVGVRSATYLHYLKLRNKFCNCTHKGK